MMKESGLVFMLEHEELAKSTIGKETENNPINFLNDLMKGNLEQYKGHYVAYQHGVCAAATKELSPKIFYEKIGSYYGYSGLHIYRVPNKTKDEIIKSLTCSFKVGN